MCKKKKMQCEQTAHQTNTMGFSSLVEIKYHIKFDYTVYSIKKIHWWYSLQLNIL